MESASTENLAALLEPETLRRTCKVLAALDVVLQPEDWLRYHYYSPAWAEGVQLAKVDNGAGDNMFCFFAPSRHRHQGL